MATAVGIDLASAPEYGAKRYRRVGLAALSDDFTLVAVAAQGFDDQSIVDFVDRHSADVVAIDSPLSLPAGRCCADDSCACRRYGIVRAVDREMSALKYHPYWALLPSMQKLTRRGIALKSMLENAGNCVIEVFPGAAQDILSVPRKQLSREALAVGLRGLGIRELPDGLNGDALDAITAAYVGQCFLTKNYAAIGPADEVQVIVPRTC